MDDNMSTVPPVNEAVNLLSRFNPALLEELKREFPSHKRLLDRGIIAGGKEAEDLRVRVIIAIRGLQQAVAVCDQALPQTRQRLVVSRKWSFYGHFCAILGGASLFGTLAHASTSGSYIAASITLLGSLASAYGQYLAESIFGKSGKLIDNYKNLVEAGAEARQTLLALEEYLKVQVFGKEADRLVRRANELCLVILSNAGG